MSSKTKLNSSADQIAAQLRRENTEAIRKGRIFSEGIYVLNADLNAGVGKELEKDGKA